MCVPFILFVCFVFKFILLIPSVYVYYSNAFLMVNYAFGDVEIVKVDYIYNTFGKGACMDSYLMDFVIKYSKQDPEMSLVYCSGERVLLFTFIYHSKFVYCHVFFFGAFFLLY